MFIEFETEIIFWVRLFRSENYDALAVFSQKMAARPKENLHPTTLRPKGRKDAEREIFYFYRISELIFYF